MRELTQMEMNVVGGGYEGGDSGLYDNSAYTGNYGGKATNSGTVIWNPDPDAAPTGSLDMEIGDQGPQNTDVERALQEAEIQAAGQAMVGTIVDASRTVNGCLTGAGAAALTGANPTTGCVIGASAAAVDVVNSPTLSK
jgi:hypothetical protein